MLHKLHPQIMQVCIVLTCIIPLSLTSCKKTIQGEQLDLSLNKTSAVKDAVSLENQNLLKEEFASLLSNVIKNDKETRLFLKEEAIKQFDLDYDILYHLIKDKKISNNESLHDKLLKYSNDKDLGKIESQFPLLTIFIPELPGGFSAETWDIENDIPAISTAIISDGKVTFHTSDGNLKTAEAKHIPGFRLLVLKDCERVQLEQTALKQQNSESGSRLSSSNFNYRFISDAFNGNINKLNKGGMTTNSECVNCGLDPKVETSYWLGVNNSASALWQRDYVYYTISPTSPNGPLDTRYQEHLTSIKFNTGLDAYFSYD
jgi:hypothetical protein